MWLVKFGDNTRHSAWCSKKEALQQAAVLEQHGYIKPVYRDAGGNGLLAFIEFDYTVECENGHYYV